MRPTRMMLTSPSRSAAVILLLGALLFGCGSVSDQPGAGSARTPTAGGANSWEDATFVVTGVTEAGKKRSLVPGSEIRFTFDEGRLQITAGCNSMGGAYRWDGSRLVVEALASTEMGCEEALMAQDAWVAGLFEKPVQFSAGNDAAIISGDVVLALADRKTVSPDRPLAGTRWVLDTLIDGEAASSLPAGVEAFLQIEGEKVRLKDGCNTGSGTVQVSTDTMVVDQLSRTRMACPDSAVVEGAFAAVLDGAAAYRITEDRLTITHDGRGLGFRADPAER